MIANEMGKGPENPGTRTLNRKTRELRGADGAAAPVGGARDLHPAGESDRDGLGPEPIVPGGEEASRAVPAAGAGHRAREADGVPERARPEALALQVGEQLTDT